MATSRVEYHPEARFEIIGETRRYRSIDLKLSRDFLRALQHAEHQIALAPTRWALYLHGTRRYLLPKPWPFAMLYLVEPSLVVVALAHTRREPGYFADRL